MSTFLGPADARPEELLLPGEDLSASRRTFLRLAGFGVASSLVSSCSRGPVQNIVPLLQASSALVPGRAYSIATTCAGCSAACGVLARCRDGRPIKLEGNPQHGLSRGGLCAVGQADILSLYDSRRASAPRVGGTQAGWDAALSTVREQVQDAVRNGRAVRVLTDTLHSPSTRAALERFIEATPGARHVVQDTPSSAAWLDACERTHGVRALPSLRLERARVIAAFEADFLGTWISPVEFAAAYMAGRRPEADGASAARMSRHVHFESRVSLTGLAADERRLLAPWEVREALRRLCAELEARAGASSRVGPAQPAPPGALRLEALADELWAAGREGLVLYGGNDGPAAELANYANHLLGSFGHTLSLARPSLQRAGSDRAVAELWRELEAGEVGVLVCSGVNPAYAWPLEQRGALARAGTLVVHSDGLDETWGLATVGLPRAHELESWGDSEPQRGRFSLTQPTVPALRAGRSLRAVLHGLVGGERADAELVREHWREVLHARLAPGEPFEAFYHRALHDGWVEQADSPGEPEFRPAELRQPAAVRAPQGLGLVLYCKVGLQAGQHAHNPWLQELPDPVTKAVWDNYACLSPGRAAELGLEDGDRVRLRTGAGQELVLPVLVQAGQHDGVVAVALGYGRSGTDRFAGVGPDWLEGRPTVEAGDTVGRNGADLLQSEGGYLRGDTAEITLERVGGRRPLAVTQDHHSLEVPAHLAPERNRMRDAARSVAFASLGAAGGHAAEPGAEGHGAGAELWQDDHEPRGFHWGMSIDLTRCTGCSACVIGCQSENNVPVVGRDEVLRHREMHWMRIDRYFEGPEQGLTAVHQPMFCQQCDHAPCESVCPVLATVHSSEGLNQQVYNRCVGTRYCANTCPYKVRRFNWFDYARDDALQNQSLNPDVTVRTRGVMEKCSFCSQRIVEAKARAVSEGRTLADGDIQTACQQSCPTQAIVFGDMNDPASRVSQLMRSQRAYGVLTELNVQPSVRYLARVVERDPTEVAGG